MTRFEGREVREGSFGPWDVTLFYGVGPGEKVESLCRVNSNILKLAETKLGKPLREMTGLILQRLKGQSWQFKES